MSFPNHDVFWTSVADFVGDRVRQDERVLAPDLFWWRFRKIFRYRNSFLDPTADYDWAILHKAELDRVKRPVLGRIMRGRMVFANEVFAVWHGGRSHAAADPDSDHCRSFFERVDALDPSGAPPALLPEDGQILPDPGIIERFQFLTPDELAAAMDRFWANGGYAFESARDKVYDNAIRRLIGEFVVATAGRDVIDIGCGRSRLDGLPDSARVTALDVSQVALELARRKHANQPNIRFLKMQAEELDFPDASFDDAIFVDTIEHVRDPRRCLAEAARVVRPGGQLLATCANTDSLNQMLTRELGYPSFMTNYQHIHEFTFAEVRAMLDEAGFVLRRTEGIFLHPYWGVPGVDAVVRQINDHSPAFVARLELLGELVGAEHSYCSVFHAERK